MQFLHITKHHNLKTLVCISHFDTVGIDDYSEYKDDAFDMDKITEKFRQDTKYLTPDAKKISKPTIIYSDVALWI